MKNNETMYKYRINTVKKRQEMTKLIHAIKAVQFILVKCVCTPLNL